GFFSATASCDRARRSDGRRRRVRRWPTPTHRKRPSRSGKADGGSGLPGLAARVPADEAVWRNEDGHALEQRAVLSPEGGARVRVAVDLGLRVPLVDDWHDDLAPRRGEAGE